MSTTYQFVSESPNDGAYFITQKPGHGWTLWYLGGSHLSLHHPDTAGEAEFDSPEAVMNYCAQATLADPLWAYFHARVFRGREDKHFPADLGVRSRWLESTGTP